MKPEKWQTVVKERERRCCVYCGTVIRPESRTCQRCIQLRKRDPHYGALEG